MAAQGDEASVLHEARQLFAVLRPETSRTLVLSASFLVNSTLTLGPPVAIPVGEEGDDATFSVAAVVAIDMGFSKCLGRRNHV